MKLFGGGKNARHSAVKAEKNDAAENIKTVPAMTDKVETVVIRPEKKKKKNGFKKFVAAIGVVAVLAVALVVGYSLWEQAPDINGGGPLTFSSDDMAALNGAQAPVIMLPANGDQQNNQGGQSNGSIANQEMLQNVRNTDCYTFVLAAYDQIGASTDTILVGKMDIKKGTLNVVSIPRDTLVNVSWGVKKVNTVMVYEDGDPERFINELSSILGFNVDCYAFVDIRAVEEMVDAIGGVYYDVPRNMEYDDPTQDLHIHIPAGYQWLGGEEAVQVLRFRVGNDNTGYANGDLGRIGTQHDFLMSIASQMLSVGNIPNISKAIDIFEEYVTTNLSAANIAFFVREFMKLDTEDIHFAMAPGEGIGIRSGSYYELDVVAWAEMINQYLNPFTVEIGLHNLDVLSFDYSSGTAMSTTGEIIPLESFYDFTTYTG